MTHYKTLIAAASAFLSSSPAWAETANASSASTAIPGIRWTPIAYEVRVELPVVSPKSIVERQLPSNEISAQHAAHRAPAAAKAASDTTRGQSPAQQATRSDANAEQSATGSATSGSTATQAVLAAR